MKFGPIDVFNDNIPPIQTSNSECEFTSKNIFDDQINTNQVQNSYFITWITRDFVQKLKEGVFSKPLPKLNMESLLKFMGDNSYLILDKKQAILIKLLKKCNKYLKTIIITPDNTFRTFWNIFMLLHMILCFFYIPLKISFDVMNDLDLFFDYFTCVVFFLDIFFNFITGNFIKGFLEMRPSIICKNYIKGLFPLDFLAFIYAMIEILNHKEDNFADSNQVLYFYRFLIFAKIARFINYIKSTGNFLKIDYKFQNFIDIIKLLFYSLFLAHILACFWHLITVLNPQTNWLIAYEIQDQSQMTQYVYSFYWTIVTIMTVGYGDIIPTNKYEALFASFAIIFGCGLYAFNLNSIGIIVQNTQKKENQFRNDLRILNSFMERKNIDIKLQRRVQEYLNFIWNEQISDNNEEEMTIINGLNETLKEELLLESYGGVFLNNQMFIRNFSEKSLRKIVKIIKEIKLLPGDEIYNVHKKSFYL